MGVLVFTVLFASAVAYFATQNTRPIEIHIANYSFTGLPLYFIVLVSLLVGLLFSWLITFIQSISSTFTLHDRENALRETKRSNAELLKRVHQLELENTRLKAKTGKEETDEKSL